MHYGKAAVAAALVALAPVVRPHSWIEELRLIDDNGMFTGAPGYMRGNVNRTRPDFSDRQLVHILPPGGDRMLDKRDFETDGIKPDHFACRISQREAKQLDGPRLVAAPGSMVAARYLENGHISFPQNAVRKPEHAGFVYIYGTTQPKNDEKFLDVFKKWDETGKGGDGRGKLLAKQPYDDGRCYEVNNSPESLKRQKLYPHSPSGRMGQNLWCQNNFKIPNDVPVGSTYSIYWQWSWSTMPGDTEPKQGKAEIYTSCLDIDIRAGAKPRSLEARADGQADVNNQAIPKYVESMKTNQQTPPKTEAPAPSAQVQQKNAEQKPSSSAQPAATQPAQAAPAAPPKKAEDIVLSALGSQLVSQLAQKLTAAPQAATTSQNPPPSPAQTQAVQQSGNVNAQKAPSPVPSSTTTITQAVTSTIGMNVANTVPASMNLGQPMMGPDSINTPSSNQAPKAYKRSCQGACRRTRIFG